MSVVCLTAVRNSGLKWNKLSVICTKSYSRRSNNDEGPYKIVTPRKTLKDFENNAYRDPNYDSLFPTKGFPFFLPGNIGPAWYDKYSTIQNQDNLIMKYIPKATQGNVVCQVQECPRVLHKTVCELFPQAGLQNVELSVVTLTLKTNIKSIRRNQELETERMAQTFVLAANGICQKLVSAGYWADFINPFSGRPYLMPGTPGAPLYQAPERFRCLDFQILRISKCKVVTSEEQRRKRERFIGSLFCSAPPTADSLEKVFQS